MTPDAFNFLSAFVKKESGLHLTDDKVYLLENRLMPLVRRYSMATLDDLVRALKTMTDRARIDEVVDALTTNESFFFRDVKPFDLFRDTVLPHLLEKCAASKSFRIWSAASSSGQEAYSLAMLLQEQSARLAGWKYEIVGTDISAEMIDKAKAGIYTQFEVQRGLPVQLLVKYFTKSGNNWEIQPAVRAKVRFRKHNLLDKPDLLGKFDVVFCRNVLIYFDLGTKRQVYDHIDKAMTDKGTLFLGGAESVVGVTDKFEPFNGMRGIYGRVQRGGIAIPAQQNQDRSGKWQSTKV